MNLQTLGNYQFLFKFYAGESAFARNCHTVQISFVRVFSSRCQMRMSFASCHTNLRAFIFINNNYNCNISGYLRIQFLGFRHLRCFSCSLHLQLSRVQKLLSEMQLRSSAKFLIKVEWKYPSSSSAVS